MSRIGKKPITIPADVTVTMDGQTMTIKGKEGELSYVVHPSVSVEVDGSVITFAIDDDANKQFWGTMRALCANMIEGVTQGFEKKLVVLGVGYGAEIKGKELVLSLGLSHKVHYPVPEGVSIVVDKTPAGDVMLVIRSPDKQKLGQTAAEIRSYRKPDVYKGKGIRYIDEHIKLKPTKSVKK